MVGNIIIIIIIIIISWSHESKLVLSQWYIGPYLKQEQNLHVKANKKHKNVTNGWNGVNKNGWKFIFCFIHVENINTFVMQVENIEKYYLMCQNANLKSWLIIQHWGVNSIWVLQ